MDPLRSRLPALLLWAALAGRGPAADVSQPWMLPPLDGELAGEFTPLLLPGAPPLQWQVSFASARPGERTVGLAVDGPGLKLRGGATLDPRGDGVWQLTEVVIDLGEWFGWLAPRVMPDSPGVSLGGELTMRGTGSWRAGALRGQAEVGLRDGRFEDPGLQLVVEGLACRVVFDDLAKPRTADAQVITWRGGKIDLIPFGPGRVEFALEGEEIRVRNARVAILGGELETGTMVWSKNRPELAVTAQMREVDIGQLLFLLPPVLSAAQGRLDGHLALQQDAAGLQIGVGYLSLRSGTTADLRLVPTPGLLSSQLPAAVQQHYPGLGQMETGGIPLRAEQLEVNLTPGGDEEGRTATVRIAGGPADPALKAPVVLQVNVRGPLDSLVKFGTNSKLRFGGSP